jgi:hypothetical protein
VRPPSIVKAPEGQPSSPTCGKPATVWAERDAAHGQLALQLTNATLYEHDSSALAFDAEDEHGLLHTGGDQRAAGVRGKRIDGRLLALPTSDTPAVAIEDDERAAI